VKSGNEAGGVVETREGSKPAAARAPSNAARAHWLPVE